MRFFHTLREKEFTLKSLKRGNPVPLLKYILYRARISHIFSVRRKHYALRVFYAPLAFWLWTRHEKEKSDELFYENFLHPGNIVLDCGDHRGTLAMTAASIVGPSGKVVACEMHPRTYSYLQRNIWQNDLTNVTAFNIAIGDEEKEVTITDEYVSDINHVSDDGRLRVPMKTIDAVAQNLPRIDLLKLDVEGYELQALRGARRSLEKTRAVYFEAAPRNFQRYGYQLKDIMLLLKNHGFSCYAFNEDQEKFPVDESYVPPVKYENILALRQG